MKWPRKGFGIPSWEIQCMGCRVEGARFGVPGLGDFMGEQLPVPAEGHCVYLSTRVNFNGHHLHVILCGELQVSVE